MIVYFMIQSYKPEVQIKVMGYLNPRTSLSVDVFDRSKYQRPFGLDQICS